MPVTRRSEKLSKELVRALSQIILYELNDPRRGFVTVLRAKLSGDMKQAKVYISVLGDEKVRKLTLHGLYHAKGFIQKTLAEKLKIRTVPTVDFAIDDSTEKIVRLTKVIEEAAEGDRK